MPYYYRQPKKSNPLKWLLLLAILVLGGVFVAFFYWKSLISAVDANAQTKAFVVNKGEGVSQVAKNLETQGFIKSAFVFKLLFKSSDKQLIEAGDYKISANMNTEEIIKELTQGAVDKWVTLLEGWRTEQMAKEISKKSKVKEEDFIKVAKEYEGYLFPDTYLLNPDASAQTLVTTLRNNFDKKFDEQLQRTIKSKGLTLRQGVILASIVEREGRSDKVRTEVAGVLLKRFNIGMKLDADATVQYAKDSQTLKQKGQVDKFWQPITVSDYSSVISTYNTYLNNGLPPAPICNPSLSSLQAVANADPSTPYLFYYHDSKGNSYYARTLEEHNQNVAIHR